MDLTAPEDREVEVSVVGQGYGECVLVHIGWGDWLVVDSCLLSKAPPTPYAAYYLDQVGVPFEAVQWLVASHWHDDHVAGIAAAVDLFGSAQVFLSEALRSEEFASLVLFDVEEPPGRLSSGVAEMRRVLAALKRTGRGAQQARADQRLFADERDGVTREIWALSPSNAASLQAKAAFVNEHLRDRELRRRLASPDPNEASVALYVRVGDAVVLLGADLENEASDDRGWKAVLGSRARPREKASLFKVAHHGADNGDHPDVWSEMLEQEVVAALTPYGAGRRPRPDDADVARICTYTHDAYLAGPRSVRRPKRSSPVEKVRRRSVGEAVVSDRPMGHVRARRSVNGGAWNVELHGEARRLCSDVDAAA